MKLSEMLSRKESIKRIMIELRPFTFYDLQTKQKVLITLNKLEDMFRSLGTDETIDHIQIVKRIVTRMDIVDDNDYKEIYKKVDSDDPDDVNFKKFVDALESAYTCPSSLLDKEEALDNIMKAYKNLR